MSCPQLDLSFGVVAHGTDPCRQFSKQVALLAGRRTLIRLALDDGYSFRPRAGWPRSRKVFGSSPSPQILKEPKSLYQAPSGASGSDSRQSLSSYRSSAVILEPFEQVLPQRWWKVFPPDLRHQSPNVKRASSSLSCSCSTRSLDRVRRSASRRNRSRSASCASRPDSTSSAMTRLALAFFTLASARTRRATPAARVTLCRRGFAVLGIDSSYTTLHQAAPSTSPIAPEPKVMGSSPIGLPVELSARAQRPVRWLPLRRFVGPAVHRRTGDQP